MDKMSILFPPGATMSGTRFRHLRELNGLTVLQVADLLEVDPKTVRRWEKGEVDPKPANILLLESRLKDAAEQGPAGEFSFIDLFAGIGGMRRGFQNAGGECVYTSEWDRYAQTTYKGSFPEDRELAGDITKVRPHEIPKHNVLVAGFPCQPFSVAGVSKKNSLGRQHGFLDEAQGTLFFDILRILKHHKPEAFLLENVKNLKGHDGGRTFEVIRGALKEELGYHIEAEVIDAKGYVPQHRERIFIAGFRRDVGFRFENFKFKAPSEGPKLESILHSPDEEPEDRFTERKPVRGGGFRTVVSDKFTLSDKLWNYLQGYAEKHRAAGNGFGFGLNGPKDVARTLSARYFKDGSEILIAQPGKNPRRLTPRECARLMGFDPDRQTRMNIPVSDTRAYKQFGNAVVVPVITEIARYMKPFVLQLMAERAEAPVVVMPKISKERGGRKQKPAGRKKVA